MTRTNDPDKMIAALNALTASGGGDEPELSLKGIENAVLESTKRFSHFNTYKYSRGKLL